MYATLKGVWQNYDIPMMKPGTIYFIRVHLRVNYCSLMQVVNILF